MRQFFGRFPRIFSNFSKSIEWGSDWMFVPFYSSFHFYCTNFMSTNFNSKFCSIDTTKTNFGIVGLDGLKNANSSDFRRLTCLWRRKKKLGHSTLTSRSRTLLSKVVTGCSIHHVQTEGAFKYHFLSTLRGVQVYKQRWKKFNSTIKTCC